METEEQRLECYYNWFSKYGNSLEDPWWDAIMFYAKEFVDDMIELNNCADEEKEKYKEYVDLRYNSYVSFIRDFIYDFEEKKNVDCDIRNILCEKRKMLEKFACYIVNQELLKIMNA